MRAISLEGLRETSAMGPMGPSLHGTRPCKPADHSLPPLVGRRDSNFLGGNRFSRPVLCALPAFAKNHPANWPIAAFKEFASTLAIDFHPDQFEAKVMFRPIEAP